MGDPLCHVLGGESDRVLSHHGFTRRCVRSNEDTVSHFQTIHRFFLEVVEGKWILRVSQRYCDEATTHSPGHLRDQLVELHVSQTLLIEVV